MMKRKFLAVVLPIIGCATVVGSGFSAWYFGATTNEKGSGTFNVNIAITDEVKDATNSLTISSDVGEFDAYNLLLDQGGYANKEDKDSGIMFTKGTPVQVSTTNDKDWNFNVTYNSSSTSIKQLYEAGLQIRFEFNIKLSNGLNKYIEVKPDAAVDITSTTGPLDESLPAFTTSDDGATYRAQYILKGSELDTKNAIYQFNLDMDTTGSTFSNALFRYKLKPQDSGAYQTMEEALSSGANINFEVIAHLEEVGKGA